MKKLYLVLLGILFTGYHLFAMSDYEVYGQYYLERDVIMSRADVKLLPN